MTQPDYFAKGSPPCRVIGTEEANELFYVETSSIYYKENTDKAKSLCHSGANGSPCQYIAECLVDALDNKEPFVRGGTTEQERTKIRRRTRMNAPRYRVPSS